MSVEMIEDERQGRDSLHDSEDYYRDLVENSEDLIGTHDLEGRILSVNRAMARKTGYEPEELCGLNIIDLLVPEMQHKFDGYIRTLIETGRAGGLMRIRTRSGEERIWEYDNSLRKEGVQKPVVRGISHDITERVQVERALQESEARFKSLFENLPIGAYRTTPDGTILNANPALLIILGYESLEELTTRNLEKDSLGPQYSRREFRELLERDGEIRGLEASWRKRDNSIIFVRENAILVRDAQGAVVYEGTVEDITEQREMHERLQASERKFRSLFENVFDGVYQSTPEGRILTANPALARMLGYESEKELLGIHVRSLYVDPSERDRATARLEAEGELHNVEIALRRKDGQHLIALVQSRVVRDENGYPLYYEGSLTDITERKKIEQLKDELISIVSHELRSPLTSIQGSLQHIHRTMRNQLPENAGKFIDIAIKSSERMLRLINEMLDIDKIESGKMVFDRKIVRLLPVIERAMEANQSYGGRLGVHLVLERDSPNVKVFADEDHLMQVLTNLLCNAAKFSPPDDSVVVSLARVNGHIRVSISDHGPGIPEEFRPHVFERFAQAPSSVSGKQGTGLGLSISKAIVEKLGGLIGFETHLNAGTTFYFELPEAYE